MSYITKHRCDLVDRQPVVFFERPSRTVSEDRVCVLHTYSNNIIPGVNNQYIHVTAAMPIEQTVSVILIDYYIGRQATFDTAL